MNKQLSAYWMVAIAILIGSCSSPDAVEVKDFQLISFTGDAFLGQFVIAEFTVQEQPSGPFSVELGPRADVQGFTLYKDHRLVRIAFLLPDTAQSGRLVIRYEGSPILDTNMRVMVASCMPTTRTAVVGSRIEGRVEETCPPVLEDWVFHQQGVDYPLREQGKDPVLPIVTGWGFLSAFAPEEGRHYAMLDSLMLTQPDVLYDWLADSRVIRLQGVTWLEGEQPYLTLVSEPAKDTTTAMFLNGAFFAGGIPGGLCLARLTVDERSISLLTLNVPEPPEPGENVAMVRIEPIGWYRWTRSAGDTIVQDAAQSQGIGPITVRSDTIFIDATCLDALDYPYGHIRGWIVRKGNTVSLSLDASVKPDMRLGDLTNHNTQVDLTDHPLSESSPSRFVVEYSTADPILSGVMGLSTRFTRVSNTGTTTRWSHAFEKTGPPNALSLRVTVDLSP